MKAEIQKFMRPRPYAERTGLSSRSVYHYVKLKILPAYKFQGVLLLDVEECDAIIRGLRRNEVKQQRKAQNSKEVAA